jgi:hypothetical protein
MIPLNSEPYSESDTPTTTNEPSYGPNTKSIMELLSTGPYFIHATMLANAVKTDMKMYKRGNNQAIVMSMAGQSMRMVFRDDHIYVIIDSQRMIIKAPIEGARTHGMVDTDDLVFIESGTARFDGRRRTFDEYRVGEERIQYFVDGDNFLGMRVFSGGRAIADMVVITMNSRVPNMMFDIPSNYTISEASLDFN